MSLAGRIAWDDTVLPFQLDRADIRGRVGRLDSVLETILGQHDYPAPVAALVAEAALITALIGQTIKLRWKLSLQIRGDGPVRLIATDYFGPAEEGAAGADARLGRLRPRGVCPRRRRGPSTCSAQGVFAILIDQGPGSTPYQGMTPIAGASLADCAETYFAQSEQLPTRFALAMGEALEPGGAAHWRGGGVLLQHMPKASPYARRRRHRPRRPARRRGHARRRRRRQLAPRGDAARDRRGDRARSARTSAPSSCCCASSARRSRGSTRPSRCASAAPAAPEKVVAHARDLLRRATSPT